MESQIYDDKNIFMWHAFRMAHVVNLFEMGDVVRKLRERKGMTNLELAHAAKVNKATLSKIENCKGGFTDPTIKKIAHALDVEVSELYSYFEDRRTAPAAESQFAGLYDQLRAILESTDEDSIKCITKAVSAFHAEALKGDRKKASRPELQRGARQ
jgi:transcriptional regulator with XRE-family HTH domain